ncbi:ABC transporter, ATP-binding protein [Rhodococcoides trifolii]|uniref:ABC transporter, ATP-binding protein n=1 Tax=Rhodococcoides trifolii TaxID=908250 RepID=A0A917FYS8_9NOCA|nr:AAA family ATPase [Rhodococcus trifolii]GGG14433.1 ABC transporter, ATP-binding protein [Rhodococcus trifolii]
MVDEIVRLGMDFDNPVTVVVGENGSGKSTLMEALASAWTSGFHGAEDALWSAGGGEHDTDFGRHLTCSGTRPQPYGGCFLRAETMHSMFERATPVRGTDTVYNAMSHGQSFLQYVADRPVGVGLWLLDEPEAALSFSSCLGLLAVMKDLVDEGSQVIMATHSPLLAAFPGADVLELGDDGLTSTAWADTDMVRNWSNFFDSPERFLRHL